MDQLNDKDFRVLWAIAAYMKQHDGVSPTVRELMQILKYHSTAAASIPVHLLCPSMLQHRQSSTRKIRFYPQWSMPGMRIF